MEDIMESVGKIRILLVDDDMAFLKIVSERLEIKGFDVTSANSGDEAIKAANKGGFDVAVLDLQMPGTDGAQVLRLLKKNHQFLEIIMLTGHPSVDSAVECTKLGAFNYLEKPYDFDKLVEALKAAYQCRMQKKYKHDQKRSEEIQALSTHRSSLGLLRALARLDDDRK